MTENHSENDTQRPSDDDGGDAPAGLDAQGLDGSEGEGDGSEDETWDGEPERMTLPLPIDWLDFDAAKVVRRLHHHDHETYLVGGCVRDLLVGRYPKDFDIATSALPREVKRAFSNCRLIGRRFRLAHVLFRDNIIEVATFRRDPNADDDDEDVSRDEDASEGEDQDLLIRDDNNFGTAEDDAFRRDFTINALYYDLFSGEVLDFVGGLEDIEARQVRTIGNPGRRFQEDPIRMLRAVKFATRLSFKIEAETWEAMIEHAGDLEKAAVPRIQEELFRMLRSGLSQNSLEMMTQAGLLRYILPYHHRILKRELKDAAAGPGKIEPPAQAAEAFEEADASLPEGEERPSEEIPDPMPVLPPFRAYLDALDHLQQPVGNHHYLGVLGLHPAMSKVKPEDNDGPRAQEQFIHHAARYFDDVGASLRLARRDREHARLAYLGFARMLFRPTHKRTLPTLSKKSYFPETVTFFGLHVLASGGQHLDLFYRAVSRMRSLHEVGPVLDAMKRRFGPPPQSFDAPEGAVRPRARSRGRRRGSNRRRGGRGSSRGSSRS